MMINRSNYQNYLADFIAGNLDAETELAFVLFLEEHPDLSAGTELEPEEMLLDDSFKNSLKKELDVPRSDELLIAEMEGDLDAAQQLELNELIRQQPSLENDRKLYAMTRLEADGSLVYNRKEELHRRPVVFLRPAFWYSAAASVALIGILWVGNYNDNAVLPGNEQVASNDQPNKKPATIEQHLSTEYNKGEIKEEIWETRTGEKKEMPAAPVKRETLSFPKQDGKSIQSITARLNPVSQPQPGNPEILPEYPVEINVALADENDTDPSQGSSYTWKEYLYKGARKLVTGKQKDVREEEIRDDVQELLLTSVSPYFEYKEGGNGRGFRLGNIQFGRAGKRSR